MQIDPKTAGIFKRLYEREVGGVIDVVRLASDVGYARYHCKLALRHYRGSLELQASAQRVRIKLRRATVIDPETLSPFDYKTLPLAA